MTNPRFSTLRALRRQRGVSLIFALMALAVISLAAVALVRSVDTTSLVIGNLGFKQVKAALSGPLGETVAARRDGSTPARSPATVAVTADPDAVRVGGFARGHAVEKDRHRKS